jgi:hypothetical protein
MPGYTPPDTSALIAVTLIPQCVLFMGAAAVAIGSVLRRRAAALIKES